MHSIFRPNPTQIVFIFSLYQLIKLTFILSPKRKGVQSWNSDEYHKSQAKLWEGHDYWFVYLFLTNEWLWRSQWSAFILWYHNIYQLHPSTLMKCLSQNSIIIYAKNIINNSIWATYNVRIRKALTTGSFQKSKKGLIWLLYLWRYFRLNDAKHHYPTWCNWLIDA